MPVMPVIQAVFITLRSQRLYRSCTCQGVRVQVELYPYHAGYDPPALWSSLNEASSGPSRYCHDSSDDRCVPPSYIFHGKSMSMTVTPTDIRSSPRAVHCIPLFSCSRRSWDRARTLSNTFSMARFWRFRRWWTIMPVGISIEWILSNRLHLVLVRSPFSITHIQLMHVHSSRFLLYCDHAKWPGLGRYKISIDDAISYRRSSFLGIVAPAFMIVDLWSTPPPLQSPVLSPNIREWRVRNRIRRPYFCWRGDEYTVVDRSM